MIAQENSRKTLALVGFMLLIPMLALSFAAVRFLGLSWSKILFADFCYVAMVSIPVYAALTKGDNLTAQPSKKYVVKYVGFPIVLIVSLAASQIFHLTLSVLAIFVVGAFVAINFYFFLK